MKHAIKLKEIDRRVIAMLVEDYAVYDTVKEKTSFLRGQARFDSLKVW